MIRTLIAISSILGYLIVFLPEVEAQGKYEKRKQNKRISENKNVYDLDREMLISGKVQNVSRKELKQGNGKTAVILLTLKAFKRGSLLIFVGPDWYIGDSIIFSKGDRIKLKGALCTFNGNRMVLAKWIQKGRSEILLRNYDGTPFWDQEVYIDENMFNKKNKRKGKGMGKKGMSGRGMGF